MTEKLIFILWQTDYRSNAYKDQFGIPHPGYVVTREVQVEVVETREVPGMWRREDVYVGKRAQSADGTEFFCNWTMWPDDSMTPTYYWHTEAGDGLEFCDAVQAFNRSGFIHVTPDGQRAIPTGAKICERHMQAEHPGEEIGCFQCYLENRRAKKEQANGNS